VTSPERPGPGSASVAEHETLRPLRTRTASQQVADRLVTALALGQFAIGERLPTERELATMLGVSRTTVRHGVALLAAAGYVSVRRGQGGGIFVESSWLADAPTSIRRTLLPDWTRLEHLFDYRCVVEAEIARVAARRRSAKNIDALRAALEAYDHSPAERAPSQAADLRLHQTVSAATGNPYFVELSLRTRHDVGLGMGVEPWSLALRERGLHQHPALIEAIIEGDDERAGALAFDHFSLTERSIRELVSQVRDGGDLDESDHRERGDHAHT
jgi:DNA-binding FadR family transcriptional regulator